MLNFILKISLKNRLLVVLAAIVLTASGLYIARNMNVDVFPDLTAPTVTVLTEAHGMESEEVEKLITYYVETAMNGAPQVRRIRSSSAAGISIVWVEFEWDTDIYRARQVVSERIPTIRQQLPEGAGDPTMAPISSIMGEIMLVALQSDSLSPMKLRTLAEWNIRPQVKALGGIANVIVLGGEHKQYQVFADPHKLKHYGITLEELKQAVESSNVNTTGGFFNEYGNLYNIKGSGRAYAIDQLEEGLIKTVNEQPILIGDVAEVQTGAADKIGDGSLNGSPAVIMTISKQPDVNTLELTERIDGALQDIRKTLPKHLILSSHIFRQSDFIDASIDNLEATLLEGAFFVTIVLFFFLWNWRTTVISLVAIPLSLLVSVIVLHLLGYTINTMSLGGLAIAIGVLVDDAIIDVENVFKRMRQNAAKPKNEQEPMLKVVREASIEIRSSIIIATFIIIVSFIPLFFLSGMEGRLLRPLGIAFITSVLTSLVVAITVTPVLCSYLLNKETMLREQSEGSLIERWMRKGYARILKPSLQYSSWVIGGTVLALIITLSLFFQLGRGFLPDFNEGSLVVSVVGPPGMSLEESNKAGRRAERLLLELPEINTVTRRTGRAELDEHAQGINSSELDAPFQLSEDQSKELFFAKVRDKLSILPGLNISLGQPISHRIDHMLSGTQANIAIKIFGSDLTMLYSIGKQIERLAEGHPSLADVAVDQQIEVPQIRIQPKRTALAGYGMTTDDLMHFIETAFGGKTVGQIYEEEKHFDLVVRLQEKYRNGIDEIKNTLIDLPQGGKVPITEVARIESVSSPHRISREDVQRKIVVAANVAGGDLRTAVNRLKEIVDENIDLPAGYRIEYGGQFKSEAKASRLLLITAILAVLVIYLLLYFEFNNLTLAGIVLLNLPLALIGSILIVYFGTGIVSIAAMIGFISLFGIATRNGILLISRYQDMQAEGIHGKELILSGALDRLNPIIITACTTALALIPLALKGGEAGNEIQSPMAVVILGGLLSATVLNLLVIPSVYKLLKVGSS